MKTKPASGVRLAVAARGAFTLIELLVVIAVIAVLVTELLPAVQSTREANNEKAVRGNLGQISTAQDAYFKTNSTYADSLGNLGIAADFPGNTANGYLFSVTGGTGGFTATATPVNPGLNGSLDFSVNQTGAIVSSPNEEAITVHEEVTAQVRDQAISAIVAAIAQTDVSGTQMAGITKGVTSADNIKTALAQFSTSGSVTVDDILTYSGQGATVMGTLLTTVSNDYKFGTAGEDTDSLAIDTSHLKTFTAPSAVKGALVVTGGSSSVTTGTTEIAFAASSAGTISAAPDLTLHKPDIFAVLDVTPSQTGGSEIWAGDMVIGDNYGLHVGGFIIGELLPAVQLGAGKNAVTVQGFEGLVIGADDTAGMTGGAGIGSAEFLFDTAPGDPFTGTLHLAAP